MSLVLVVLVVVAEARLWHYEGHHLASRGFNQLLESSSFSYEGATGPQYWASLDSSWAVCGTGTTQSPVSLSPGKIVKSNSSLSVHRVDLLAPVEMLNNGHTFEIDVKLNTAGKNSYLMWNGVKYFLLQFHFHQNSEHHVEKYSAPLEMHMVHESADGKFLVLGIFLDKVENARNNHFLRQFWEYMPKSESNITKNIQVRWNRLTDELNINEYWSYLGSLTVPPCTEGVQWVVLSNPIPISYTQWHQYTSINGFNSRLTQSLFSRDV